MLKVGLTGGIAVGKSFVLSVFAELGCVTFDADKISRDVVEPGNPAYQQIVATFGTEILQPDGCIDRAKLGSIIFADSEKRLRLNQIVHPHVFAEQNRLLAEAEKNDPNGIAIVDAALMIESGGYKRFDKLIVVFCEDSLQKERLMQRNNLNLEQAVERISAQMPTAEKRKFADFEIDTSKGFDDTRRQVIEIVGKLRHWT
jgi:dephospho-CoA kinase